MADTGEATSLGSIVDAIEIGGPTAWGRLELVPLAMDGETAAAYLLAEDALAQNLLAVEALPNDDRTLCVNSRSQSKALVVSGQELFCKGQGYLAAASMLINSNGPVELPACRVEKGASRDGFSARCGAFSPPRLRAITTACRIGVTASHPAACRHADALRMLFDGYLDQLAVKCRRRSMEALRLACAEQLEPFFGELHCPCEAQGVIAFANGRFIGMDLFGSRHTLGRLWPRLLAGYALDALASNRRGGGQQGVAAAMTVLGELASGASLETMALGPEGGAWIRGDGLVGALLADDGRCVHLCAFPEPALAEGPLLHRVL